MSATHDSTSPLSARWVTPTRDLAEVTRSRSQPFAAALFVGLDCLRPSSGVADHLGQTGGQFVVLEDLGVQLVCQRSYLVGAQICYHLVAQDRFDNQHGHLSSAPKF